MDTATEHPMASILIVEDDPQQVWLYTRALRDYRLTCVPTASGALEFLQRQTPDLILLDHILGQGELGAEFLPRLKEAAAHVPVIMISGTLDIQGQLKVLQGPRSASFVVTKPVDLGELEKTIEIALTECGMGEAVRMLQSIERTEKADLEEPDRRYVDRLARQHDMLKKLRASGDPANVSQLSRDYQVSRRTIARDLRELVQRGQIPAALYPEWDKETTG
jgi:CheY-like chemotaxis protein